MIFFLPYFRYRQRTNEIISGELHLKWLCCLYKLKAESFSFVFLLFSFACISLANVLT